MPAAILFPRYDHPAIEERYASWQSKILIQRQAAEFHRYDREESAAHAVLDVDTAHVLVVTDPLLLPSPDLVEHLIGVLDTTNAFAALPVSNESLNPAQRTTMPLYMTLREMEIEAAALRKRESGVEVVTWDASDAAAFLCATSSLQPLRQPLVNVLTGRQVAISRGDFVHRWASLRGQMREDLLERIAIDAKSVLEFGCGEGALGEALKRRQKCRVVGIEIDRNAAAKARKRLDDVYCGDAREIIELIEEQFDWIVGGDIIEHLDEPWTFLAELRRIARPGGKLLLSLPNVANASIVADLLQGRFDYVYMGLTCVGHLRFFTRRTVEDMLTIAGWELDSIEPQTLGETEQTRTILNRLETASVPFSRDAVSPTGYYVIARNPAPP